MRLLFVLLSMAARPGAATESLSKPLRADQISPTALALLNYDEPRDVTLRRLVTMDRWTLEHQKGLPRRLLEELHAFVRTRGLDFYLTAGELEAYARSGAVPPLSIASRVDRLELPFAARGALRSMKIVLIAELAGSTRERFVRAATPARTVKQIAAAVQPFGIVVYPTARERVVGQSGRLEAELVPIERLGVSERIVNALHRANVWNLTELKERDRGGDLTQIPRLGRVGLAQLATALERHGYRASWRDPVETMNLPSWLLANLALRRVRTRHDLRRFVNRGGLARLVHDDRAALEYVRVLLDDHACAAGLEVVDVETE